VNGARVDELSRLQTWPCADDAAATDDQYYLRIALQFCGAGRCGCFHLSS
jgi:hypothetical protein